MENANDPTGFRPEDYPLLDSIKSPEDLRRLPIEQLNDVAAEIRRLIISTLSENPGHFASSMGAVEIAIALHYVFNTPDDRIVWDVGHQAYAHKILTGRFRELHTLRKSGGLSGFPNPKESPYDTFTAGHASNSISAALGMSVASKLNPDANRQAVAVIGDASIAGGMAFEAINNAANTNADVLIILNDNDMSIDRNTGSLNSYLAHITTSKAYNKWRFRIYRTLKAMRLVSDRQKGFILRFNNSLKSFITREQNIFEGLNLRYIGPFDGHDIPRIVRALREIKDMKGPRLLHLRTVKGKGFNAAEADPAKWHAPGTFDPETGKRLGVTPSSPKPPKFQDVFGETLVELAAQNPRIVAITAAMPSGTSVSKMAEKYPNRTFDVGISEGHAVTFAGGMAKDGLLPYVAIYSSFLQRGYDQIIHDVAIQHLPVVFCIDRAGLVGEDGVTHHGTFDTSYLRPIPGLTIAAPRDEHMLRNMMYTAQLHADGPWAIRYPRGRGSEVDWRNTMHEIPRGKAEWLAEGTDVAVLTLGPTAYDALEAARLAARNHGLSMGVADMVFLKPLDTELLEDIARRRIPVITVEDASAIGGLGSAVAEWIAENASGLKLKRLGIPDKFIDHGSVAELHRQCRIDAQAIVDAALEMKSSSNNQNYLF